MAGLAAQDHIAKRFVKGEPAVALELTRNLKRRLRLQLLAPKRPNRRRADASHGDNQ
jgi:hypothetical protein